jgi:hypothetical protein
MKSSTPELMKFQKLQRRLKESRRGVIGLLEGLWLAVGKNCPRGDIGKFSNEEIAIMCDWENDADELVNALVECGWLDVCSVERLVVHDWDEHCPTYIKGNLHSRGQQVAIAVCYSESLNGGQQPAIATCSEHSTTKSSLVKPNQANSSQVDFCVEPPAAATPDDQPVDTSFEFFVTGDQSRPKWHPPIELIDRLEQSFDSVDVRSELTKAATWTFSNRNQRKTASGMPRFLFNWLTKAANSTRGAPTLNTKKQRASALLERLNQ